MSMDTKKQKLALKKLKKAYMLIDQAIIELTDAHDLLKTKKTSDAFKDDFCSAPVFRTLHGLIEKLHIVRITNIYREGLGGLINCLENAE